MGKPYQNVHRKSDRTCAYGVGMPTCFRRVGAQASQFG
jgi:hypothetical protein